VLWARAQLLNHLQAIHHRHANVRENQVDLLAARAAEPFPTIFGFEHASAFGFERQAQQKPRVGRVIDD
jgi:hypothetical protein